MRRRFMFNGNFCRGNPVRGTLYPSLYDMVIARETDSAQKQRVFYWQPGAHVSPTR